MHNTTFTGTFTLLTLFLALTMGSWTVEAQVKKSWEPRYNETVKGDVTMIANNMLSDHPTNSFNTPGVDNQDSDSRVFVDIDSDPSTFNSSSANLTNPEPGISCLEFTRAYLYWAASDKEAGGPTQNNESWNHANVKLMLPGSSSYMDLTADEVLYRGRDEGPDHFYNDPYICVKEITSMVQGLSSPYGKYQVANVKAAWGGLRIHQGGGNVGVAGGWQIVFVYESNDLTRRNITLFDGYSHIANNQTTEFMVDGFLAVPTGDVKANIILGSIEGDNDLDQDNFQIKKPDGNWEKISTPLRDENNFFSSRITRDGTNFVDRNPASTNTLGYDASVFELNNPGNSLIANGQTSTSFRASSGNETYGLYLVGFAIEVYEPSLGALEFTTNPLNSDYDPGEVATLSLSIENTGNDNVRNLQIVTELPDEVEFDSTQPLPPGTTFSYNSGTRELTFFVEDGYTDVGDPKYNIDFNLTVNGQCYFLEGACEGEFEIQAEATYTGEINPEEQTTDSSGTLDECGMGNHDPSVITINQPAQLGWGTADNALDVTIECDDTAGLSAAQSMEPTPEDCTFALDKVSGPLVEDPSCDVIGTYTNTWTFTDGCGRTSVAYTQVITVEDNTAPTFNEALPADTTAAYDNIPAPETLTASDTCDTNPQVVLDESYIGDNTSTTYIIVRTWTASDCAGNQTEHTQKIYVTENGDPIGLAINDASVNENAGTAVFTVTLTGEVSGGFTVDYFTVNGTAIAPGDFTAIATTQLSFTGTHGEGHIISVTINDDSVVEEDENYEVNLSNLSTTEISINDGIGTGTIIDNDSASVSVSDLTVNEAVGTAQIEVVLTGNTEESFTVDFATTDGSANSGSDYTAVSGQVTFPTNSTNGAIEVINVPITDDNFIEPSEDFLVDLTGISATGSISISDDQAIVTINDNDATGTTGIRFDATDVTVNEDAGTATFTVSLEGNVQGGFTLDYATADGSAVAGDDYSTTSGTLTFAGTDGESYNIMVPINDDVIVENTEVYNVDLMNLSTPLIPILTPQATGTILDNDSENDFPSDTVVSCDAIPEVPAISLNANGCSYTEVFEETISGQDDECATEYTITRTWTITDCADNVRIHVQIITVEDTIAPQFVEALPSDASVSCDNVPDAIILTATDNCDASAYVTFEESISGQGDDACPSVYVITRTWTAWDCAGNSTTHVQVIDVNDTEAPTFIEALPQDMTVMCNEVPDAEILTALDNCDPNVEVVFEEFITNDANCAMGYTITRNWSASDCAGNMVGHSQTITIPATGPITASDYQEEVTILCGDDIPEVPALEFMGGCGNYEVVFNEEIDLSDSTDDYMIIRTWDVTDSCGNTASFEQIVFVMQPQLVTVTLDICVEDDPIDLLDYLPEGFDTNGVFEVMSNNYTLVGSTLNPLPLDLDNQTLIAYSSTEGTCKYYVDFVINANTDCVPCGRDDIVASKTITANGDGMNDYFEITGVEFCDFNFDLMIFNRWGAKVYEGKNYQNDWGGFSPGNAFGSNGMLPAGTYYYIIQVTNRNFEPITGYIYLGSN